MTFTAVTFRGLHSIDQFAGGEFNNGEENLWFSGCKILLVKDSYTESQNNNFRKQVIPAIGEGE